MWGRPVRGLARARPNLAPMRREYNFASSAYNGCFAGQPVPDGDKLRADTLAYLGAFDPQLWYDDPVTTVLDGKILGGGSVIETVDAFNAVNGRQVLCTAEELQAVRTHIHTWQAAHGERDYRSAVRRIEQRFLGDKAGALIGNQAIDFKKQDGVTEMEESVGGRGFVCACVCVCVCMVIWGGGVSWRSTFFTYCCRCRPRPTIHRRHPPMHSCRALLLLLPPLIRNRIPHSHPPHRARG
eukprot:COSAG05_NODE_1398_length_4980_cov_2.529195_4_plen_240_part_00